MKTLLENPIILVILIGIISSFFKKVKTAQQESRENGKPNPLKVPPVKVEPVRRNKKQQRNSEGQGEQHYPQRKPANNQNERNNSLEQRSTAIKNNQKSVPVKKVIEEVNTVQIDTERLVDGIIWSEVLGPPRSKKPHRSIKNN